LAVFGVGTSLSQIKLRHIDKKAMFWMVLAKLIVLPVLGLLLILRIKLPELIGLMILIQLAMPPATSLSVVTANYKKEDLLISQGIFIGHIVSIFTIPLFLSLYFILSVIK
jgi:predicted permease